MKKRNTQRSIDLVKALRPKQQAALLFEARADMDEAEADRIRGAVAIRHYSQPHAVFKDWWDAMDRIALVVHGQIWRHRFITASIGGRLMQGRRDLAENPPTNQADLLAAMDREDALMEDVSRNHAECDALLKALDTICTEHGFSFKALLKVADMGDVADRDLSRHDPQTHALWLDCFESMLPKYAPHQGIRDEPAA